MKKRCPFCAEEIQEAAQLCKHCGKWLDPDREAANKVTLDNSELHVFDYSAAKLGSKKKEHGCVWGKTEKEAADATFETDSEFDTIDLTQRNVGRFSCPNCRCQYTTSRRDINCVIVVIIFISLGIGAIMIPFLPFECACPICKHRWRT